MSLTAKIYRQKKATHGIRFCVISSEIKLCSAAHTLLGFRLISKQGLLLGVLKLCLAMDLSALKISMSLTG